VYLPAIVTGSASPKQEPANSLLGRSACLRFNTRGPEEPRRIDYGPAGRAFLSARWSKPNRATISFFLRTFMPTVLPDGRTGGRTDGRTDGRTGVNRGVHGAMCAPTDVSRARSEHTDVRHVHEPTTARTTMTTIVKR